MTNIQIYSAQHGYQLHPDVLTQSDDTILRYFNNNISLIISKKQKVLEIICHILAHKGTERDQGYYVKYETLFSNRSFNNFKSEAEKILNHLEFTYLAGSNKLYENIENFDSHSGFEISNLNTILYALKKYKTLEYEGNNINEISNFCKYILEKRSDVTISISPESNTIGNINILLNEKIEQLYPTENTDQILKNYNNDLQKQKKIKIEQEGIKKIKDAIDDLNYAGIEKRKIKSIFNSLIEETPSSNYSEQSKNIINYKKKGIKTDDETNRPPRSWLKNHWVVIMIIFMIVLLISFMAVFIYIDANPDFDINNFFNHSSESS